MNKRFLLIATLCAGLLGSCKKSTFDQYYNNPDLTTTGTIDGLFTGMLKSSLVFPQYYTLYTFQVPTIGRYTQSVGLVNGEKMYVQSPTYNQARWNAFYTGPMASFREIEKTYNKLTTDDDKQGYLLFLETARVFLYDQATQMVDYWGDIPFSQAGHLNATNQLQMAAYDKGQGVYDSALTNLQRISSYLADVQVQALYQTKLAKQDYLLGGDILRWRKYTNSLLLRLAMRISYQDEAKAKGIVQTLLGNPDRYPLVTAYTDNVQIKANTPSLISTDMESGLAPAYAPGYMLDSVMKPATDPRIRVFYAKNVNGTYNGISPTQSSTQQDNAITAGVTSRLDSVTYIKNTNFPGIVLTAAEVNFCKAEAYERWGGGDVKTAYEAGIRQSVAYYFVINNLNGKFGTPAAQPTEGEITAMLATPTVALGTTQDDILNKIGLQKWIDFNVMLNFESWAELRRSGYPKLNFVKDAGVTSAPTPPTRLLYPDQERTLNAANYKAVAAQDDIYQKVFWQVK